MTLNPSRLSISIQFLNRAQSGAVGSEICRYWNAFKKGDAEDKGSSKDTAASASVHSQFYGGYVARVGEFGAYE